MSVSRLSGLNAEAVAGQPQEDAAREEPRPGVMNWRPREYPGFSVTRLRLEDGELMEQLAREAGVAYERGYIPCLTLCAFWCLPCRAVQEFLPDPLMVDAFRGTHIIRVDTDELALAKALYENGMLATHIPKFFILDRDGRPTGDSMTGADWGKRDVPETMAPVIKDFFEKARQAGA